MENDSKPREQILSEIRITEAQLVNLTAHKGGGVPIDRLPFVSGQKARLQELYRELSSVESGAANDRSSPKMVWKLKAVDLAVLLGVLYENGVIMPAGGRQKPTKEEFFDAAAKLFVNDCGKVFDGHSLRTQYDRATDPVLKNKSKSSPFLALKKILSNLQK